MRKWLLFAVAGWLWKKYKAKNASARTISVRSR